MLRQQSLLVLLLLLLLLLSILMASQSSGMKPRDAARFADRLVRATARGGDTASASHSVSIAACGSLRASAYPPAAMPDSASREAKRKRRRSMLLLACEPPTVPGDGEDEPEAAVEGKDTTSSTGAGVMQSTTCCNYRATTWRMTHHMPCSVFDSRDHRAYGSLHVSLRPWLSSRPSANAWLAARLAPSWLTS